MPEGLLAILKFCFLAGLWLFFVRVVRVAWAEVHAPAASSPAPAQAGAAPAAAAPAGGAARVTIVEPAQRRGSSYELGQELKLGRSSDCHISLSEDSFVSQAHARLYRQGGKVWLEDLGSTNGTYLNSAKVSAPAVLHRGDRIQLGRTVIEVKR